MNDTVKVGLDEFIVADPKRTDLITDGLSGCVAVGLSGQGRISLAHVYSNCNSDNWPAYEERLQESLVRSGIGGPDLGKPLAGVQAAVVLSEDQPTWLSKQLESWLTEKGASVQTQLSTAGCRIGANEGELSCIPRNGNQPQPYYRYDYATSADAHDRILDVMPLSNGAAPAGPAALRDAQVSLKDPGHPANPMFEHILTNIPPAALGYEDNQRDIMQSSSLATLTAAALTVECLKHGMKDPADIQVDARVALEGGDWVHAGKDLGKANENRVGVNYMDAEEMSLPQLSKTANDLQLAMTPAVVGSSGVSMVAEMHSPKSL